MKRTLAISTFLFLNSILFSCLFYMYMTSERPLYTSKDIVDEIKRLEELSSIKIVDEHGINSEIMFFSYEHKIKNLIRRILDKTSLTNYGSESGNEYRIALGETSKRIIFRTFIIGDHVYGINIRFLNFEQNDQEIIFIKLSKIFRNIEIFTF
ncbi:hypothetical protein [Leptospira selangorensis]|uniref:hypothetical protein n=1 Tax=Leptospira selangorensis TaxID=2484982 RepID=UPI001083FF09|nr:hypothetical protein [Leptospira selangorensis]